MQPKEIVIDLTGSKGLVNKYNGDVNRSGADVNLRYIGVDGQFVDGVFNPIKKYGYLSPSNKITKSCTVSGATSNISSVLTAAIYDQVNSKTILAVPNVLNIASSTKAVAFTNTSSAVNEVTDLTFYEVNGRRMLYILTTDRVRIMDSAQAANVAYDMNWLDGGTPARTTLASTFNSTDTTMVLTDGSSFGSSGTVWLTGYMCTYTGRSTNTLTGVVSYGAVGSVSSGSSVFKGATGASSLFTTSYYNKFVPADNGFLYVLNKNRIHKIDGTSAGGIAGTLTYDVLNTSSDFIFYDGIDYKGNMFIVMNQLDVLTNLMQNSYSTRPPAKCGIYIWDRISTIVRMRDFIPLYGMKDIRKIWVAHDGKILVIAVGTNNSSFLFEFTGSQFNLIHEIGANAYPMSSNGVVVGSNCSYWFGADGFIYGYGFTGGNKNALFKLLDAGNSVGTPIAYAGALLITQSSDYTVTSGYSQLLENLYFGYKDTSDVYGIRKYIIHGIDTQDSVTPVAAQGNAYSLVKFLPTMSTVKHMNVICAPNGSAGSSTTAGTIKIYFNQSTTPFKTVTVTRGDMVKGYIPIELNKPFVTSVQIEIEFDTSQQLGSNDFCPAYATLSYLPTTTIK